MRIALVTTHFPCLSETFVLNQITGLIARGHDIDVFAQGIGTVTPLHEDAVAFRLRAHYPSDRPQGRRRRGQGKLRFLAGIAGLTPHVIRRALGISSGVDWTSRRRLLAEVGNVVARAPYDSFLCHFGDAGTRAVLLRDVTSPAAPVVTMFHGEDVRAGMRSGGDRYRLLKERGNCFLAICRFNRERLLKMGFPSPRVLDHPVGVSLQRFGPRPSPLRSRPAGSPTRLITVARLERLKGLQHALAALSVLVRERPHTALAYAIVGDGSYRRELERQVSETGLGGSVRFLGAATQDAVAALLRDSDLFVLPSLEEALPVCLLEAQAVGLPTIATDVGGTSEVVLNGVTGLLVPPGDVRTLAAAVTRLIDAPPSLLEAMGQEGRRHVARNYDIDVLSDRLDGLLRALVRDGRLAGAAA